MAYVDKHMDELRSCLQDLQLPPLVDRTAAEVRQAQDEAGTCDVTVAILSRAPPRFSCLVEGGKQLRESVFIVLSHEWLERRGDQLYLKRGVWHDPATRQTYVDRYEPARRVTYFANFFTRIATFGERVEGEALEDGVHTALSLSCKLEPFVNDKLFMRTVLERGLVSFPRTLGFVWKAKLKYGVANSRRLSVVRVNTLKRDAVASAVRNFVDSGDGSTFVLKRGGPERAKKRDVRYFDIDTAFDALVDGVCALLPTLPDGNSVLVEEFLHTMPSQRMVTERMAPMVHHLNPQALLTLQAAFDAEPDDELRLPAKPAPPVELSFVVRALSVCDSTGAPVVSSTVAVVGNAKYPVNVGASLPLTLIQVLRQWGVADDDVQATRIIETVKSEARRVHELVLNAETEVARTIDGLSVRDARSDVISVDFVLALAGALVTPQVLRVHDHDSLTLFDRLETITHQRGAAVRPWISTMIARSQAMALRGKVVVIVGGGSLASRVKFQLYVKMGIKVVLVDDKPREKVDVLDLIWHYVRVPTLGDHSKDAANAAAAVEAMKAVPDLADPHKTVDAVTCVYDPCVVVGSHLARLLGKHGNDPDKHEVAKDKFKLARLLESPALDGTGVVPAPRLFIARTAVVKSLADIDAALDGPDAPLTLPAVLKNTHGMCGIGVVFVHTVEQAKREFTQMRDALTHDIGSDASGLSFDSSMFLMEYLDGTEHDVDIVMYKGELLGAIVTDNGPTRLPLFNESSAVMPSVKPKDEVNALIAGAHQCCLRAGLHSGVYNVEMKSTSNGPRLIEINARIGGFYLIDWAQRVHNVDLLRCVIQIACNIRPALPAITPKPNFYMAGLQLYPAHHGKALQRLVPHSEVGMTDEEMLEKNTFRRLQSQGVCRWICMSSVLDIKEDAQWQTAYGNVGCQGRTAAEAATNLISLVNTLELDADTALPVEHFMVGLGCIPLRKAQPTVRRTGAAAGTTTTTTTSS